MFIICYQLAPKIDTLLDPRSNPTGIDRPEGAGASTEITAVITPYFLHSCGVHSRWILPVSRIWQLALDVPHTATDIVPAPVGAHAHEESLCLFPSRSLRLLAPLAGSARAAPPLTLRRLKPRASLTAPQPCRASLVPHGSLAPRQPRAGSRVSR